MKRSRTTRRGYEISHLRWAAVLVGLVLTLVPSGPVPALATDPPSAESGAAPESGAPESGAPDPAATPDLTSTPEPVVPVAEPAASDVDLPANPAPTVATTPLPIVASDLAAGAVAEYRIQVGAALPLVVDAPGAPFSIAFGPGYVLDPSATVTWLAADDGCPAQVTLDPAAITPTMVVAVAPSVTDDEGATPPCRLDGGIELVVDGVVNPATAGTYTISLLGPSLSITGTVPISAGQLAAFRVTILDASGGSIAPDATSGIVRVPVGDVGVGIAPVDRFGNVVAVDPSVSVEVSTGSQVAGGDALLADEPILLDGVATVPAVVVPIVNAGLASVSVVSLDDPAMAGGTTFEAVAGPAARLVFADVPAIATAGTPAHVRVEAFDAHGNVTDLPGPVSVALVTFGGGQASTLAVSGDVTEAGTATIILTQAGRQDVVVLAAGLRSEPASILVRAGPAVRLLLEDLPAATRPGLRVMVTVLALDAFGNPDPGYRGLVALESTDVGATLPTAYRFRAADGGRHRFAVTYSTEGTQTLTVREVD